MSASVEAKVEVVPNGVDVGMFDLDLPRDNIRSQHGWNDRFVVLYAGALGYANDLETLIEAASLLSDSEDLLVVLVGDGRERPHLEWQTSKAGLSNVSFLGARPKSEIPALLAAADVCVAILRDVPMFTTTYPNKVFDYMAAGKPTVLAIDGVIREVLEASNGGRFVTPGDPQALAAAIAAYASSPEIRRAHGANARAYVRAHFSRESLAEQMESCLKDVRVSR